MRRTSQHLVTIAILLLAVACGGGGDDNTNPNTNNGPPTIFDIMVANPHVGTLAYTINDLGFTPDGRESWLTRLTGGASGVYRWSFEQRISELDPGSSATLDTQTWLWECDATPVDVPGYEEHERVAVELTNHTDSGGFLPNDFLAVVTLARTVPNAAGREYVVLYTLGSTDSPEDPYPGHLCDGGTGEPGFACPSGDVMDPDCAFEGVVGGTFCDLPAVIDY